MTARTLLRGATGLAIVTLVLLASSPAGAAVQASGQDDGQELGAELGVLPTLLIFVGIPAALFVGIAMLVSAPSLARGPRYRPGLGWWASPVWFNGPADADAAVRNATPTTAGGGASARW